MHIDKHLLCDQDYTDQQSLVILQDSGRDYPRCGQRDNCPVYVDYRLLPSQPNFTIPTVQYLHKYTIPEY